MKVYHGHLLSSNRSRVSAKFRVSAAALLWYLYTLATVASVSSPLNTLWQSLETLIYETKSHPRYAFWPLTLHPGRTEVAVMSDALLQNSFYIGNVFNSILYGKHSNHGDVVIPDSIVYRCGVDAVFQHHASISRKKIRAQALRQVSHDLQYHNTLSQHYFCGHAINFGTGDVDF